MTNDAPASERTPLEDRLIDLIKLKGPITVADYMADALGHPHDGYYTSQAPIGADGDFTTAPETSQVFGELIGLWLVETWRALGAPAAFNLIELGPGRGVMMEDILRAARLRPEFARAAQLWLVETSGRLRVEQQRRLRATELKPMWADDFGEIAPAPSLIVANEFFDCLPVRQFQHIGAGWRERLVGLNEAGDGLAFVLDRTPPPESYDLPDPDRHAKDEIVEVNFAARDFMERLCAALNEQGGCALIIDYGHVAAGVGDTLQAVRRHEYWPPLAAPGRADLTAHVDFNALFSIAAEMGLAVYGPETQGRFLDRLGLTLRVESLCRGKSGEAADAIRAGAARIAAPQAMGELFKVMAVAAPDMDAPPGFAAS